MHIAMEENSRVSTPNPKNVQTIQSQKSQSSSSKTPNPQNPFDNAMENVAYRSDYRKILPQVLLPNYQIPLQPDKAERRAIRKYFNKAGFWMFITCVSEQFLYSILYLILLVIMGVYSSASPYDASIDADNYINNSSIGIAINALVFALCNALFAWIGCRSTQTPIKNLFQTHNLRISNVLRYFCTGLGLQCLAGFLYNFVESFFASNGVTLVEADFSYFQNGKSTITVIMYTCILAPLTEELLYRGFLMKTLSRVSTRFGIIMSALLFGLAHGNVEQFLLAFILGLYLGKIVERHNSIVPSILVHMGINTTSIILSLMYEKLTTNTGEIIISLIVMAYYATALMGIFFWFWKEQKTPIPYSTQKQAVRNRVAWSSPWLFVTVCLYIGIMILNQVAS